MPVSSRPTFQLADIFGLIFAYSILFAFLRLAFLRNSLEMTVAAFFVSPFLIGGTIGWAVARNLDGIIRGVFGAYCFPLLVGLTVGLGVGTAFNWFGIPFDTCRRLVIALIIVIIPLGGWIGGHWAAQDRREGDL